MLRLSWIAPVLLPFACTVSQPKQAHHTKTTLERDSWKASALWLYATADSGAGHEAECKHVHDGLNEETSCAAKLCRYGAELSQEWLEKCAKHMPQERDAIDALSKKLRVEAKGKASSCSRAFDAMLDDCGESCAERAQSWASRCSESEAGPLVMRILERKVAATTGNSRARLDKRSCATLREGLHEASRCKDVPDCKEAWKRWVVPHRSRCEADEGAPLDAAVWQLRIAAGEQRELETVRVASKPETLSDSAVTLVLADQLGAVVKVCLARPTTADAYREAREGCGGATLAHVQDNDDGVRILHVGRVSATTTASLAAVLPWVELAADVAKRESALLAKVRQGLDVVFDAETADALPELMGLVNRHAELLRSSDQVRALFGERDEALVPLFIKLAAKKVSRARSIKNVSNRRGLVNRARRHAFADVADDGTIKPGAPTAAFLLPTAALAPKAMGAYLKRLDAVDDDIAARRRPGLSDIRTAADFGRNAAERCGAAEKRMDAAAAALTSCLFRDAGCGDGEQQEHAERWHGAKRDLVVAQQQFAIAHSVISGLDDSLDDVDDCAPDDEGEAED